jgi:hypothetical protein
MMGISCSKHTLRNDSCLDCQIRCEMLKATIRIGTEMIVGEMKTKKALMSRCEGCRIDAPGQRSHMECPTGCLHDDDHCPDCIDERNRREVNRLIVSLTKEFKAMSTVELQDSIQQKEKFDEVVQMVQSETRPTMTVEDMLFSLYSIKSELKKRLALLYLVPITTARQKAMDD